MYTNALEKTQSLPIWNIKTIIHISWSFIRCPHFLLLSLCLFTYFVNTNDYFDFVRNSVVTILFLVYFFFLLLYIYIYIQSVAHLTMTTFVQEHFLYLLVMNMICSITDVVLTSCWLCLFMIREPGITQCPNH